MFAGRHPVSIIGSNWCLSEQLGNHTTLKSFNFRTIHCTVWDPGTYRQCCHLLHKSHLHHLRLCFTGDGRARQWCTSRSKFFRSIEHWVFYNSSTALFVSRRWAADVVCCVPEGRVMHLKNQQCPLLFHIPFFCLPGSCLLILSLPEHPDSKYNFIK